VNLDLFDQRPNAPVARRLSDGAVEGFVPLMESIAVARSARFALPLELGEKGDDLTAPGALGGEPRRRLLERLANDDRFRKRGKISMSPSSASLRSASRTGVRLKP